MDMRKKANRTQMTQMVRICTDFISDYLTKSASSAFVIIILFFAGCGNKNEHSPEQHNQHSNAGYICPMRCEGEKTYAQPGQCPVCNMNLELKLSDATVQSVSPSKQVLSRQATVKLQPDSNSAAIQAQGYIDIDRTRNQTVSARFGGRIEKLYVKFNMQSVKQGEKIMELYSPELLTIQEEHLFLLKSGAESSLAEKSRERLRLLGITENQITQLEKNGTTSSTVAVFSPSNGFVFFDTQSTAKAVSSESTPAMNGMGMAQSAKNENSFDEAPSQIRKGMYVNKGQPLFTVNDLQQVWAMVSVPGERLSDIRENQPVEIISESNPSQTINGKIAVVEKIFEENSQRFARVRVILPNSDKSLKINSLVTARIAPGGNNLFVPASAVYKTGMNSYVWVKADTTENGTGIFQLRKVIAGVNNNGMTSIISGISPGEEIAREAGFMTDSEAFLGK